MRGLTMFKSVVCLTIGFWLASAGGVWAQIIVTNNPAIDAFVRSADPTHNYGADRRPLGFRADCHKFTGRTEWIVGLVSAVQCVGCRQQLQHRIRCLAMDDYRK